jgi:hypothetical protein
MRADEGYTVVVGSLTHERRKRTRHAEFEFVPLNRREEAADLTERNTD